MSIEDALFVDLRGGIPLDAERANAVAQAGFRSLLLHEQQLQGDPADGRRALARAGVSKVIIAIEHADSAALERAEAFGAAGVVVTPTDAARSSLRTASLMAAELGLAFTICPAAGSALEQKVMAGEDFGEIPLCLQTDRMLAQGRRPADFRKLSDAQLGLLQLTDRHLRGLQRDAQALPGLGHLTLAPLVALLARKGFVGPWVVSAGAARAEAGDLETLSKQVRLARQALLNVLDQASFAEPSLQAARAILPPRVQAKGFEFIELAIDARTRAEVETVLSALSFRRERQHHSAPVELWRQGAINIVLNEEIQAEGARPFVCDMGLRVDDAHLSAQRAGMLGAHHHAPSRQPGRLPIPAMRDSLGTIVHFIDQKSDTHRVWDIEFTPTPVHPSPQPAGLRRVDHMAQIMPEGEMDSLMLYYLSTFGLRKRTQVEMQDPAGMVASQALETPEGEVRIALNGVDAAHVTPASTSVQHVALQTDDIFETAAVLAANGFAALPVPSAYYQNIAQRFDLDPDLLAALTRANALYDRNSAGGEFFQVYSLPLSSGLFFEIVQRKGGYSGYGAANSPVRRAALAQLPDHPAALPTHRHSQKADTHV